MLTTLSPNKYFILKTCSKQFQEIKNKGIEAFPDKKKEKKNENEEGGEDGAPAITAEDLASFDFEDGDEKSENKDFF